MERVYWDSNCFIDFLQGNENGEVLKCVMEHTQDGSLQIVTSSFTIVEVIRAGGPTQEDRDRIVRAFSEDSGILVVDLTRDLAEKSRKFIWDHQFDKHREDAIHMATAMYVDKFHTIDEFHTFDHDLLKFNGTGCVSFPVIAPTKSRYPGKPKRLFEV